MQISHRLLNRLDASASLNTFLVRHAEKTGAKLTEKLQVVLRPGESMPDFVFVMRLFARYLMHLRGELKAADFHHRTVSIDYKNALAKRDELRQVASEKYRRLTSLVKAAYGKAGLRAIPMGKLGQTVLLVREQVMRVLNKTAKPDFAWPESDWATAVDLSPEAIEKILGDDARAFYKSVDDVNALRRKLEDASIHREKAIGQLDVGYQWIGFLARAFSHLVGRHDLAERTHKPLRTLDRKRPHETSELASTSTAPSDPAPPEAAPPEAAGDERPEAPPHPPPPDDGGGSAPQDVT